MLKKFIFLSIGIYLYNNTPNETRAEKSSWQEGGGKDRGEKA